jgi:hypothetical protein
VRDDREDPLNRAGFDRPTFRTLYRIHTALDVQPVDVTGFSAPLKRSDGAIS